MQARRRIPPTRHGGPRHDSELAREKASQGGNAWVKEGRLTVGKYSKAGSRLEAKA